MKKIFLLTISVLFSMSLFATTFTVINANDSGAGSLKQAVTDANNDGNIPHTINMEVGGIIPPGGTLLIFKHMTINAPAQGATLTGDNSFRVLDIALGVVVIMNRVSIANGRMTVNNVSQGGSGILNRGTLYMNNCTIYNNIVERGMYCGSGPCLTVSPMGGAIRNEGGSSFLYLTNCTVSGNSAQADGSSGAIYNEGTVSLINCTVVNNTGDGSLIFGGILRVKNTIIAKNHIGNDINSASLTSDGYNLIEDSPATVWQPSDILGVDPLVSSLADNGGTVQTHALLTGSPAINAGTSSGAPLTDQRGFSRMGSTDIGAYEFEGTNLGTFLSKSYTHLKNNIYPVPARNQISISMNNSTEQEHRVTIYNLSGGMEKSEELGLDSEGKLIMEVSDLSPGLYFVCVASSSGMATGKFIKE